MRVLVTGGTGFVGSHLVEHLLVNTDSEVVVLGSLRHRGVAERLTDSIHWQHSSGRVTFHSHDLRAPLSNVLADRIGAVDVIYHLAAESHVDRSIMDPVPFVESNVALTLNILEYARQVKPRLVVQFSTDEVYGPAPVGVNHVEWSPILPSNPYSASKAAQEAIAIAYWRTYGVPVVITNTMNVFGERQHPEKFIPKTIRAILAGEKAMIHGAPGNIGSRYYIHGRNVADALLFMDQIPLLSYADGADRPRRYNIVGEREVDNLTLAQMVATIIGQPLRYELVDFHAARPGHDRRYALDGGKLAALGWQPPVTFEDSLARTVEWSIAHPEWLELSRTTVGVGA